MGIKINTNFNYSAENFLDDRSSCESLEVLRANVEEILYPRGFEVYCRKEGQWYINTGCKICGDCPVWEPRGLDGIDVEEFATKDYVQGRIDSIEMPSVEGLATEEYVQEHVQEQLEKYPTKDYIKGQIDLSLDGMATEKFVKDEIKKIDIPEVDLEPYATREYVKYSLDNLEETHLNEYATKEYVKAKIEDIPEVDLTDYATQDYVRGQIAPLASEKYVERKLQDYTTKEYVSEKTTEVSTQIFEELSAEYATKEYVTGAVESLAEITASEEYVRQHYATKNYVQGAIDSLDIPDVDGLATEEFVKNEIAKAQLDGSDVDLSGFVSKSELEGALSNKADRNHIHSYNDLEDKPEIPSIEGLASEQYVQDAISAIEMPEIPSIEGLASEEYVREQIAGIEMPEVPSIEGLATEEYVDEKITELDLENIYATKVELNDKAEADHYHENFVEKVEGKSLISNSEIERLADIHNYDDSELRELINSKAGKDEIPSIEGLASEEFVRAAIAEIELPEVPEMPSLDEYAKKEDLFSGSYNDLTDKPEIPSIDGLASEAYVQEQIAGIEFPEPDLTGYATENFVKAQIDAIEFPEVEIPEIPSIEGLATEDFVRQQIEAIEFPEVDLSGLASEEYVRQQIEAIEFPETDLTGYATEEFVNEKIAAIEIPEVPSIDHLATKEEVSTKVEKEEGKSLVQDSEITRLAGLFNANYQFKINMIEADKEAFVTMEGEYPNIVFTFNIPLGASTPSEPEGPSDTGQPKMWYGYAPYDETGANGFSTLEEINEQLTYSTIDFGLKAGSLIECEPEAKGRIDLTAVPANAWVCAIVPNASNLNVLTDDGIGGKITFEEFNAGVEGAIYCDNTVITQQIDGVQYRMSGMYQAIADEANFIIYIDEK